MPITRLNSARDVFRVWFTWKKQAVASGLLIVFFIMSFAYLYTPNYESAAKIMVLPKTGEGTIISSGPDEKRVFAVSMDDINSEIEILTSEDVIRETVQSFVEERQGKGGGLGLKKPTTSLIGKVTNTLKKYLNEVLIFIRLKVRLSPFENLVGTLRNSLEVEPVAMSSVIEVTLTAEQPKAAERVLDRLLEVYVRHHNKVLAKEEGIGFFADQAEHFQQKLADAASQHKKFQKEWGIIDLPLQNISNIEELSALNQSLKMIDISYLEAEARIKLLKDALAKKQKEVVYTREMRTIPAIVDLENSIGSLLVKRSEIQKRFAVGSREVLDLDNQIEMLRQEVVKEIKRALKTDELELRSLAGKRQSMHEQIQQLQEQATLLNEQEARLNELERQVELYENNYKLYAAKAEDAHIFAERRKHDLANVSIASKACLPVNPSFPKRMLMLIVSIVIGVFSAMGTPFLLEFFDHRVKTPHDVEDLLSVPVICSLPAAKH